jgi:hypothetical protein
MTWSLRFLYADDMQCDLQGQGAELRVRCHRAPPDGWRGETAGAEARLVPAAVRAGCAAARVVAPSSWGEAPRSL